MTDPVGPGTEPDQHSAFPTEPLPQVPAETAAAPQPAPGFDHRGRLARTRISGVWIGLVTGAVLLILLIVFIAQNAHRATIHFLGWSGHLSLGLALLLAAALGILLVAAPATARIVQLRRSLHATSPAAPRSQRPVNPRMRDGVGRETPTTPLRNKGTIRPA
jgi:uncharacterized integral membrane protein